ncbi:uncharacterized protein LOC121929025 [Sceloporus undulatus]|uniref:uncharacterized protein LOC121929025 n=1 Tax=Sceloporus undulatus TaxID=8520 RepID=UPI001C4C7014|nr:uncharacterized protein LOC121929025 [Sceloporus undulatus]
MVECIPDLLHSLIWPGPFLFFFQCYNSFAVCVCQIPSHCSISYVILLHPTTGSDLESSKRASHAMVEQPDTMTGKEIALLEVRKENYLVNHYQIFEACLEETSTELVPLGKATLLSSSFQSVDCPRLPPVGAGTRSERVPQQHRGLPEGEAPPSSTVISASEGAIRQTQQHRGLLKEEALPLNWEDQERIDDIPEEFDVIFAKSLMSIQL